MRKALPFVFPLVTFSIISLSFLLLGAFSSPTVLGAKTTIVKKSKNHFTVVRKITPTPITTALSKAITPTSTPTPPPTPLPTSTPTPTLVKKVITPTPTTEPTSIPVPKVQESTNEIGFIMNAINSYRSSQGLAKVSQDPLTCSFAATRAKEIASNFNHDGFTNRINSHALPYPSYHEITENIVMTSDYKEVVSIWINSPGHAENMRKDTPFVCVAKYGNYYAYEGLRI